jgi:hypothetical protein
VLLLSSGQDKYAPFYSARIEMARDAVNDKKKGTSLSLTRHMFTAQSLNYVGNE